MARPSSVQAPRETGPADPRRIAGRRRIWLVAILLAVTVTAAALVTTFALRQRTGDAPSAVAAGRPFVGGDLHAVAVAGNRLFVSGHAGAAFSDGDRNWTAIRGLEGKDGMGWALVSSSSLLVGGHEGLYVSSDNGATFEPAPVNLPVTDVHALGSAGQTVYLASPQAGMFVSTDGGRTFVRRGAAGQSFMGTILVDPANPDRAIAPDMTGGLAETADRGRTWRQLGGPQGAMAVGWDPRNHARMIAVGMAGVMLSTDAGRSWQQLDAPAGTSAATIDTQGRLVAAALVGDSAKVEVSDDSGKNWLMR